MKHREGIEKERENLRTVFKKMFSITEDGTAFFNAIRQAKDCVAGNVVQTIAENTGKPVKK